MAEQVTLNHLVEGSSPSRLTNSVHPPALDPAACLRASLRIALVALIGSLLLGGCGAGRLLVDPSLAFDHDGYSLSCDGVERDPCIARADELGTLIEGRNGTIRPTTVRIRDDGRFLWCWERRPEAAVVALIAGRRGSGCMSRLGWMQRP